MAKKPTDPTDPALEQDEATDTRLNELDKEDFREATRDLWPPDWDEAQFDAAWIEFVDMKRRHQNH